MSTSSEETDFSSSYSTEGDVPCAHTKLAESLIEIQDTVEVNDADSFVCFFQQEDISSLDQFSSQIDETYVVIPSSVHKMVDKSLLERIKSWAEGTGALVCIKSPLLAFFNDDLPAPTNVICDVFLFKTNGSVYILTFVRRSTEYVVNYNSTLARYVTVAVRRETGSDFHPVHGVIGAETLESQDSFNNVISTLEEKVQKVSIPLSLNSEQESLRDVLRIFSRLLGQTKLSRHQSERFAHFIETTDYMKTREQLNENSVLILTGSLGEGKTTLGKKLCFDYQLQGYNTVFYSRQEDVNWELMNECRPTLLVCDNIYDEVEADCFKEETKVTKAVLLMQEYALKSHQSSPQTSELTISRIDNTEEENYKILNVLLPEISEDTFRAIMRSFPSSVGLLKAVKYYCQCQSHTDVVSSLCYPLDYYREEIEKLTFYSNMAEFMFVLLCGGRVNKTTLCRGALKVLQSKLEMLQETDIQERIRCFEGSFFIRMDNTVSFRHQAIYDACLFVLDTKYPGLVWEDCQVHFESEGRVWTQVPELTIFISECNIHMLLSKHGVNKRQNTMRYTLIQEALNRNSNNVGIVTEVVNRLKDIIQVDDDLELFLFWIGLCRNEDLCKEVLGKREIIQDDVDGALMRCIRQGDTKSFLFLKKQLQQLQRRDVCYRINAQDWEGNTFLMTALLYDNFELINVLIEDNGNLFIRNLVGNTALHLACQKGNIKVVKTLLLKMKCHLGLRGQSLRTPVMMAVQYGHLQLFQYLLEEVNCGVTDLDIYGNTILHLTFIGGNLEIANYIASSTHLEKLFRWLNKEDSNGRTPLMVGESMGLTTRLPEITVRGLNRFENEQQATAYELCDSVRKVSEELRQIDSNKENDNCLSITVLLLCLIYTLLQEYWVLPSYSCNICMLLLSILHLVKQHRCTEYRSRCLQASLANVENAIDRYERVTRMYVDVSKYVQRIYVTPKLERDTLEYHDLLQRFNEIRKYASQTVRARQTFSELMKDTFIIMKACHTLETRKDMFEILKY